jgi:hypothetical protein
MVPVEGEAGRVVDDATADEVVAAVGSVVEGAPPAFATGCAVAVDSVGVSDAACPGAAGVVSAGPASGMAAIVGDGGGGGAAVVGTGVVGVDAGPVGVPQSERFSGLGGSPAIGAGGSNPGGGVSTATRSSEKDQPSTVPGGGVRVPGPMLL